MRILHGAETIKGGVATVMAQLAQAQGHEYGCDSVLCLVPHSQLSELGDNRNYLTAVFRRDRRGFFASLRWLFAFLVHFFLFKPDVVHLHSTYAGFFGRIALFPWFLSGRVRVVYCPHAWSFMMNVGRWQRRLLEFVERFLCIVTDKVICVSEFERSLAEKAGFDMSRLLVIHNGVADSLLRTDYLNRSGANRISVLYVGRFDYQKGFDVFLDAVGLVDLSRLDFVAVGDAVNSDFVLPKSDGVRSLGWLPSAKVSEVMASVDVVVVPSRWEGFAMVPLEAMRHGLPVISSDASSLPEVVIPGHNGYLFRSGDSFQLASILNSLRRDTLVELGSNARTDYELKFSARVMVEKVSSLYRGMVKFR